MEMYINPIQGIAQFPFSGFQFQFDLYLLEMVYVLYYENETN